MTKLNFVQAQHPQALSYAVVQSDPAEQMGAYEELRAMIDAEIKRLKKETPEAATSRESSK